MTVYVLMKYIDWSHYKIIGVFNDRIKALQAFNTFHLKGGLEIKEFEINKINYESKDY